MEPTRLSEEDIYDPLFHGDAAAASAASGTESTGLSPEDIYDPLFHGDGGVVSGTRPSPDPLKVCRAQSCCRHSRRHDLTGRMVRRHL